MKYLVSNYKLTGYEQITVTEIAKKLQKKKVIGFDTETTGLDPHTNHVIMIQMGDLEDQYIIDARCSDVTPLREVLESKDIQKVGVNLGFDYKMILGSFGWRCQNLNDLMINEMCLRGGFTRNDLRALKEKQGYSMAGLAEKYLHLILQSNQLSLFPDIITYKDTGLEFTTHQGPFLVRQANYGANDVIIPLMIWEHQQKRIKEENLETLCHLENLYLIPRCEMEFAGAYIDQKKWDKTWIYYTIKKKWATFDLNCMLSNINKYDRRSINWRSSKQVIKLFNELGIDTKILDKKKSREQGEDIWKNSLEKKYIQKKKHEHPIIEIYLRFKEYDKLTNTYGHKFLRHINEVTQRLHTSYWQIVKTGRSSSSPNLQNIPRGALHRRCFTAQYDDTTLVVGDYSGQELRIVADRAGEDKMIKAFLNKEDVHALTASGLYGMKITEEEHPRKRYNGKILNFAIIYGASAKTISETLNIPIEEAKKLHKNYFKTYKKIDRFLRGTRARALKEGVIQIDSIVGRKHWHLYQKSYEELDFFVTKWKNNGWPIPKKINSWYWSNKGKIERDAGNYTIQGTAASMTKLAIIYLYQWIHKNNLHSDVWLVNTIHDEIVVECRRILAETVKSKMKECMELAGSRFCNLPIIVKPVITNVWKH